MYGKRIKELREEKGLTQTQLAKALHCKPNTISRYEAEVSDLGTEVLIKICDFFDVPADYILGRIDMY